MTAHAAEVGASSSSWRSAAFVNGTFAELVRAEAAPGCGRSYLVYRAPGGERESRITPGRFPPGARH
ncbi:hypothetical protein K8O92_20015 [Nocardia asteroides]|nr:hypothetical protein K8O92_20015 [Nocardia asteroides]